MIWKTPRRTFDLSYRGLIMGVLNVTPDSFSDGGRFFEAGTAAARAKELEREGADIIDIGGESTRPGAVEVPLEEELRRVLPVVRAVKAETQCLVSIDTMKSLVAAAAMEAGADIINDISGLHADPDMAAVAAGTHAGLVLMHMQGTPRTMQMKPVYADVVHEVQEYLRQSMDTALRAGVEKEAIALDPGIGFGKTLEHNLTILRRVGEFGLDGRPVLLGVSRKSFIGRILGSSNAAAREWPTVALTSFARERGARIFRVHEVIGNVQALRMTEAILGE
ncbi:MAG TPA: dihydropteroate synthase [Verrucomicrobiales bacterium]|nr:dihydropteroate synthase [Verrucomicrobiales bacterium]